MLAALARRLATLAQFPVLVEVGNFFCRDNGRAVFQTMMENLRSDEGIIGGIIGVASFFPSAATRFEKMKRHRFSPIPRVAGLLHSISLLAPDAELYYWLFGPQQFGAVPRVLMLDISYTDLKGNRFGEKQRFNFAYFGVPGSDERGVDTSRQNNDPIVRQLKEIAAALLSSVKADFA
jgi:hypothetical protein